MVTRMPLAVVAHRRRRRAITRFILAVAASVALATPAVSSAAVFTATPGDYTNSGAGPFEWRFQSSFPLDSSQGGVAYKLPNEQYWHRCSGPYGTRGTLEHLPEGTHDVLIADDVNVGYFVSIGQFYSGHTQPCQESPPQPPAGPVVRHTLTVDGTPPVVAAPRMTMSGAKVLVSVVAEDALAGVANIRWEMGDGYYIEGDATQTFASYSYLAPGSYNGSVTVADRAGNRTRQQFTAVVASRPPVEPIPAAPAPIVAAPAPTPTRTGVNAPQLTVAAERRQRIAKRRLRVRARCGSDCTLRSTAKVVIGGRGYKVHPSRRKHSSKGQWVSLDLRLPTRTTRAVEVAASSGRDATARIRIAAVDTRSARLTTVIRIVKVVADRRG